MEEFVGRFFTLRLDTLRTSCIHLNNTVGVFVKSYRTDRRTVLVDISFKVDDLHCDSLRYELTKAQLEELIALSSDFNYSKSNFRWSKRC